MKFGTKLSFGVVGVQSGQKSTVVNATPQLIANTTVAKFTITSPVSKALSIAVGDNVMFLNNIAGVELALQNNNETIIAYAAENNIDLTTREGQDAVIKEFTQWFIAKGVPMYTAKGAPIMASERYTKADKEAYLKNHAVELVEANRASLVEAFGELSDEELMEKLTIDMIESPKYHANSGSKTSTSGSATGVGCQLSFSDTSIWNTLKSDLGDNKDKKNRVFDVVLEEIQKIEYNNGCENVTIDVAPISFVEDVDPIVRGQKD